MNLQHTYSFNDILIEPLESNIKTRKDIDLSTNIGSNGRELILKTPLISSPMDTVTNYIMAIEMALNGGIGIIHRYMTLEEQIKEVLSVKRHIKYVFTNPYKILINTPLEEVKKYANKINVHSFCVIDENNIFLGLFTKRDIQFMNDDIVKLDNITINPISLQYKEDVFNNIITNIACDEFKELMEKAQKLMIENKVEKIPILHNSKLLGLITWKCVKCYFNENRNYTMDKFGRLCVGTAIGIRGDYIETVDKLVEAGCDLICIDVANGHNTNVIEVCKNIREKYQDLIIMAGNICNNNCIEEYVKADIDCLRVGIGNGSICSTRLETGIGNGQFSSLYEIYQYLINKDLTNKINLISDGGSMGKTGNKVKALSAGASAIMMGKTLASTEESPGKVIIRNGKRVKYYRGMASTMANLSNQERNNKEINSEFTAEGVDGVVEIKGNVLTILNQIKGGLRSGLSYLNSNSIERLHELRKDNNIMFRIVSANGYYESSTRI